MCCPPCPSPPAPQDTCNPSPWIRPTPRCFGRRSLRWTPSPGCCTTAWWPRCRWPMWRHAPRPRAPPPKRQAPPPPRTRWPTCCEPFASSWTSPSEQGKRFHLLNGEQADPALRGRPFASPARGCPRRQRGKHAPKSITCKRNNRVCEPAPGTPASAPQASSRTAAALALRRISPARVREMLQGE